MKILTTIILILFALNSEAQKTTVRGYRYEKALKSNLARYDSAGKKIYVIWAKKQAFVYPNPTRGLVFFSEYGDAIVNNAEGRTVRVEKNVDRINLQGLSAGTYFITIVTDDFVSHHVQIKL